MSGQRRFTLSRGALYMALSALGFSVMSLLVKLASARMPTGELVLARAVVTLVISYVMVRRAGLSPWGNQRAKLVLRGLLGFGGLSGYYLAISMLPLAEATTIQHTTPLLTAVLAWWVLREPVGWPTAFAIACGVAGVALIAHPTGGDVNPVGVLVALGAASCSAVAYVTVRQLVKTEDALVIVFYFPLIATPLAVPWAAARWIDPTPLEWLVMVGIGVATQFGQVFLTKGLAVERAGRATAMGYLQVMFAIMWQWTIFGDPPALATLAGAALIVAGTLTLTGTREAPEVAARTGR